MELSIIAKFHPRAESPYALLPFHLQAPAAAPPKAHKPAAKRAPAPADSDSESDSEPGSSGSDGDDGRDDVPAAAAAATAAANGQEGSRDKKKARTNDAVELEVERHDARVAGIMSATEFAALELSEPTAKAIQEMGFTFMTEVQVRYWVYCRNRACSIGPTTIRIQGKPRKICSCSGEGTAATVVDAARRAAGTHAHISLLHTA